MERLILTPNENRMCGMYQLAKSLDGDIGTVRIKNRLVRLLMFYFPFLINTRSLKDYDEVVTFLYPTHLIGKKAKKLGKKWICYDQKVPNPYLFKNFWRRQYMKIFLLFNEITKQGADEYWELDKIKQEPRYCFEIVDDYCECHSSHRRKNPNKCCERCKKNYAIYIGRTEDYKNFDWLKDTMDKLKIPLIHPINEPDNVLQALLSNAKLLVTASLWEGYGRPVMEAQALGIPVVCYDVGVHKKLVKNGYVIPVEDKKAFMKAVKIKWNEIENENK